MATETFRIGHAVQSQDTIIGSLNARYPFQKPIGILSDELIVDTDFTSGNDLVFEIPAIGQVYYASFVSNVGAVINFAEAALTSETGRKLTLSAVSTNVKYFIVTDT